MALIPSTQRKRRLGELLMDVGLIDQVKLDMALSEQRNWGGKLGRTLVEMRLVTEEAMAYALSQQLELPLVDLDTLELPPDALEYLRVDIAERYGVFPLGGDRKLRTVTIASSDPTHLEQLQEVAFHTGMKVQLAVASPSSIDRAIRRHYYGESTVASDVTTPQQLGLNEPEYDLATVRAELSPGTAAAPPQPFAARSSSDAGAASAQAHAELVAKLDEATDRVEELERIVAGQSRVLRGMLELLLETGVIDREAYLARIHGKDDEPR